MSTQTIEMEVVEALKAHYDEILTPSALNFMERKFGEQTAEGINGKPVDLQFVSFPGYKLL